MKKPSCRRTREFWDVGVAIAVFLALVAMFWVYLVVNALNACYHTIIRHQR